MRPRLEHRPRSSSKRERRCACGASFQTPQELRRHVRKASSVSGPELWADAIAASQLRRQARS